MPASCTGIGIAGVKGFGGGFGQRALGPWGEPMIKQFVHEAVNEALKLEAALARLRTERLVALLHYAPVQQTVEGEPLEIYPFLGFEPPRGADRPLPGVARRARPRAPRAARRAHEAGVPVYNVSMPLLTRLFPDRPPFRVFEVPGTPTAASATPFTRGTPRLRRGGFLRS